MPKKKIGQIAITPEEETYLRQRLEEIAKKKSETTKDIEQPKDLLASPQKTYQDIEKQKEDLQKKIEPISKQISDTLEDIGSTLQQSKKEFDKTFEKFDKTFSEFINKLKPPKNFEEYTQVKDIWEWLSKYGVAIILGIAGMISFDRYGYRLGLARGFIEAMKQNDMERYEKYLEQWERELELDRLKLEMKLKQNEVEYERLKQATDIDLKTKELKLKQLESQKNDLLYQYDMLNQLQLKVLDWLYKGSIELERLQFQYWKTIYTEEMKKQIEIIKENSKQALANVKMLFKQREISGKELNQALVRIEHQISNETKLLEQLQKAKENTTDPDKITEIDSEIEQLKSRLKELNAMREILMKKQWGLLGITPAPQPQSKSKPQPQPQPQSQSQSQNTKNYPPRNLADIIKDFFDNLRGK